jgi:hypothetical protein
VVETADYSNEDGLHINEEYYMHLDRFEMLTSPLKSSVIMQQCSFSNNNGGNGIQSQLKELAYNYKELCQ